MSFRASSASSKSPTPKGEGRSREPRLPIFTSANGVGRLAMNRSAPPSYNPGAALPTPIRENRWAFTTLACAINIGLEILESPRGRNILAQLGHGVLNGWWQSGRPTAFNGDPNMMDRYITYFLSRMREDFPIVFVNAEDFSSVDQLAHTKRIDMGWNGDLLSFQPKDIVGFYFNHHRVSDMSAACEAVAQNSSPRMVDRHQAFLFMFSIAAAHEIVHAFVAYLAQGGQRSRDNTPPNMTHLDYGRDQAILGQVGADLEANIALVGESGRWFEAQLLGGSLEFYYDPNDDDRQCGLPHILDHNEVAHPLTLNAIRSVVCEPRALNFPLEVVNAPISRGERMRRNIVSIGSTQTQYRRSRRLYMAARNEVAGAPRMMFNVAAAQLRNIPTDPRPLQGTRVG